MMKSAAVPLLKHSMPAYVLGKTKGSKIYSLLASNNNYILLPAALLLGRAELADGLMPFGFAFFAAAAGFGINKMLIAAAVLVGILTGGGLEQLYITGAAMLLFSVFSLLFKNVRGSPVLKYSCLAFLGILIPQVLFTGLQGFLLYDLLRSVFCSFIVFVIFFVFRNTLSLLTVTGRKNVLGSEEMISIAITAALAVSGISGFTLLGFSPKNILCILMVLLFSFKCGPGVGAAAGVAIGLIVSMSSEVTPLAIGTYAFCGLLSGIFRGFGKAGSGLGFVLGNAILAIYLDSSAEALIYFKEILLCVGIFFFIPQKLIDLTAGPFNRDGGAYADKRGYTRRVRDITIEKLDKFSRAFKELAKTFGEISQTKVVAGKQDLTVLLDRVADRVCKDCSLCLHCWDRNFYDTYQVMFRIVEGLEAKGRIEVDDIPPYFLDRCERINDFADAVNSAYELFKVDMVWKNRIGESRGLISQQFEGLSTVISSLAEEIDTEVNFSGALEDEAYIALNNAGIKTKEVVVYKNKWNKYEVGIIHAGCGGGRICISLVEKTISGVLGRQMVKESEECKKARDGQCSLKLVEEENLKVMVSVAKQAKHGSAASGDSFTFMNAGNGKYFIALSDGMGSGYRAAVQSKATVNMLENFLESGFDKDMAVKLVNSVLVMKSTDDTFSTMDVSVIDLFSGETEFVKIGAAPTYLKTKDRIELVKSASLPAGILVSMDTELVHKNIDSGDMLIMMTDGIVDSFGGEDEPGDRALMKFIQEISSINPQQVADEILGKAVANCDGKPLDDMTVVVAKVWKRYR